MSEERLLRVLITFAVIVLLMGLGIWVIWKSRQLLTPALAAMLTAYLLYPIMKWTTKIGISKWLTVTVLMVVLVTGTAFLIYSLVPLLNTEIKVLSDPSAAAATMAQSNLLNKTRELSEQLHKYGLIREPWTHEMIKERITHWFTEQQDWIVDGLGDLAVKSGQFLMIFFFTLICGLLDGDKFYKSLISFLPNHLYEAGIYVINKSADMFGYYLRGVVIESFILFILALGLFAPVCLISPLTFTLALVIAAIYAITNVVRIVGPIFGAVAGVIIVLSSTPDLKAAVGVLLVAVVVQLLDNLVVLPLVMEGQVNIHPVFSMIGVLAGGAIGGVLGMIMAIPVIAGIKITYRVVTVEMKRFQNKPRDYGFDESIT